MTDQLPTLILSTVYIIIMYVHTYVHTYIHTQFTIMIQTHAALVCMHMYGFSIKVYMIAYLVIHYTHDTGMYMVSVQMWCFNYRIVHTYYIAKGQSGSTTCDITNCLIYIIQFL